MKKALIVGLGIAGMSAAISLKKAGWEPVIIERAPERRRGGYFIGLFPNGVEAAKKLGAYENIKVRTPGPLTGYEFDKSGSLKPGIGFVDQPGDPQAMLRGDIEEGLWQTLNQSVEIFFGTVPVDIQQNGPVMDVKLKNLSTGEIQTATYDLVIGADGIRSTVRSLVFGPHEQYMKSLDAIIVAFQMKKPIPDIEKEYSLTIAENKRSLWFFGMKDTIPTALFTYRTKDIDSQFKRPIQEVLHEKYAGMVGDKFVDYALSELEKAEHPLVDSVHQVKMPKWSKGNVVLLGDSAWCLTLYSGMGATAGLIGATILGEQLAASPNDILKALENYEKELRPLINKHQKLAYVKSQLFVPSNPVYHFVRRNLMTIITKKKVKQLR